MENDTEVIKHQMEETRTALSEKLEAVEELVASTVKETTQTVSETVAAVTDKVENTVNTVSDTVSESVQSVKDALDITGYVDRYPWLMMGAGVAVGYGLGRLLGPVNGWSSAWTETLGAREEPSAPASTARTSYTSAASTTSSLLESFGPVIDKLKGLALGTAVGVIGDMLLDAVPENLKSQVSELIDDTTRAVGGTNLRQP